MNYNMFSRLSLRNPLFGYVFWGIVIAETASLLAQQYPLINDIAFFLIIVGVFVISCRKPEIGFWVLASELVVGSFGYIFYLDVEDFRISVRLAIFLSLMAGWLVSRYRIRSFAFWNSPLRNPLVLLLVVVIGGIVQGLFRGYSPMDVFFDANSYLFFGIALVAYSVITHWERVTRLMTVICAGITYTMLKTWILAIYFSHQRDPHFFRFVYHWIHDTKVGEISPIVSNYYRIFFQDHIWVLFAVVSVVLMLIVNHRRSFPVKDYVIWWIFLIAGSTTLIISFSRSIWLAAAITIGIMGLFLLIKHIITVRRLFLLMGVGIGIILCSLGIISGLVNLPLPGTYRETISTGELVSQRLTTVDEPALGSRFQLLRPLVNQALDYPIFGSGYGTSVTYTSLDPRTKDVHGGQYTTYSFEWGYLDIVTEIGTIGLAIFLYFIWRVLKSGTDILHQISNREVYWFIISLSFAVISLLVVHSTTPYLNHPLGIFLVVITAATYQAISKSDSHILSPTVLEKRSDI